MGGTRFCRIYNPDIDVYSRGYAHDCHGWYWHCIGAQVGWQVAVRSDLR